MLCITRIKPDAELGYLANESGEGYLAPAWWGNGAEALGLLGQIPDVSKMKAHRGGHDFVFAAPMACSLLYAEGNTHERVRLLQWHENAVDGALRDLEVSSAMNLVVSKHVHVTARDARSFIHTHAVCHGVGALRPAALYASKTAMEATYVRGMASLQLEIDLRERLTIPATASRRQRL